MKPITYWLQNDAINQLVDVYGSQLEIMTPGSRRDLIACLAGADNHWTDHRLLLENLTRYEKDLLIEAIAATLTHQGNPVPEDARDNGAIAQAHTPQKTGTPAAESECPSRLA